MPISADVRRRQRQRGERPGRDRLPGSSLFSELGLLKPNEKPAPPTASPASLLQAKPAPKPRVSPLLDTVSDEPGSILLSGKPSGQPPKGRGAGLVPDDQPPADRTDPGTETAIVPPIIPGGGGSPGGTGGTTVPPSVVPPGGGGGTGGGTGGGGAAQPPPTEPPIEEPPPPPGVSIIPSAGDLPDGLSQTTMPGTQVPGAEHLGEVPDMPGPTFWDVTGEELTSNRMADLLDSGHPVLQAWQESTRRAHARYGGQNSLMANQAAVAGMMEMAFSIASADAQVIARSREFNAAMANQYGLAALTFMHNAMLSDQNFRQAQIIQREQLANALAQARIAAGVQMAAINADMTIAREGFAHQIEMAGVNHGYAINLMGTEYGLMMGRDTNLANLDVRNTLLGQTNQADLNLRNQSFLSDQAYRQELGSMYYGAGLQDWRASQDFQRQRILNYDQYRIQQAADAANMLTNLGIQPGMSDTAIAARLNDLYSVWNSLGLMGDSFYLNGTSNDDSYPDYFTYPPPTQRGRGGG